MTGSQIELSIVSSTYSNKIKDVSHDNMCYKNCQKSKYTRKKGRRNGRDKEEWHARASYYKDQKSKYDKDSKKFIWNNSKMKNYKRLIFSKFVQKDFCPPSRYRVHDVQHYTRMSRGDRFYGKPSRRNGKGYYQGNVSAVPRGFVSLSRARIDIRDAGY